MINTHRTNDTTRFRQERFISGTEFEPGFEGNLIAQRCSILSEPQQRDLIYFLQSLSHREGGLAKVANDLIARYPERIGTKTMLKLGLKPDDICGSKLVKTIRSEIFPLGDNYDIYGNEFKLKEDFTPLDFYRLYPNESEDARREFESRLPVSFPAKKFIDLCFDGAHSGLVVQLKRICLDPQLNWSCEAGDYLSARPFYFPELIETLHDYMRVWIEVTGKGLVRTALGEKVHECLDYCLSQKVMVIIDGNARTGKTFATKQWCQAHPGQVRYVQVPSTCDAIGFYRAIAKSLGVSINPNSKAQQLRALIEDTLQFGHLMVVFDEAHYLWPQGCSRGTLPGRINWIMTALVNYGVPVAMVTTPQFGVSQKAIENQTKWTSEQFVGRVGHYERLPEKLKIPDLAAVARALAPELDEVGIQALANYAYSSDKNIAGIDFAVKRARYLAEKESRTAISNEDVGQAIACSVIPSDNALIEALRDQPKKRSYKRPAPPMQAPRIDDASGISADAGRCQETNFECVTPRTAPMHAPRNEDTNGMLEGTGRRRETPFESLTPRTPLSQAQRNSRESEGLLVVN